MVTGLIKNDDELAQSFSDPEDYVDNVTDEELLPELMSQEPRLEVSTERVIVVDNIPKVGTDKKDKLKRILTNLIANYGKIVNELYPEDENGILKGYLFVEYENEVFASEAVSQLNGYRLDKAHTFKVNFFADFERYKQLNLEKMNAEQESPVPYKNPGQLMWWLLKPECHDQYCLLYSDMFTTVYSNTPNQPTVLKSREKWTETRFQWSPKGTYLSTFHERGIALWAGEEFNQYIRFAHTGVQLIDFSPNEKFVVTCNPSKAGVDDQAIIVWCVRSGQKKRSFSYDRSAHALSWPYFKWNHDDKYFARLFNDTLLVYDTQTFTLLDKKSIKISNIADFEWSPSHNQLAYWVREEKNVPARVVLMELPSKQEIRSKNLVNVVECKMYWQSSGDYLCVRVERYKKSNVVREEDKEVTRYSGIYYNFEFFRLREKEIPVDSIEIKETCHAFAWEPNNGQKFAIIYGESASRTTAAFYKIVNAVSNIAGKVELIKELKNRTCLQLAWSPAGQYCVLATTASKQSAAGCSAEFVDVQSTDVLSLNKIEHEHMSDFEWDPTGRYFVTYVSYWNYRSENAYLMWSFQGKSLQKVPLDKLYKFSWRPRPPSILSAEQIKEIRKNLRQYSEKYNAADRLYQSKVSKELLDKRRKMMEDFSSFKRNAVRRYAEQKQRRAELRGGIDTEDLAALDELQDFEEYTVQFLVESKKEEVIE